MSSYSSPRTPNDADSDMDFSIYSPSSEFDLDFTFRSLKKGAYNKEEDLNRKHFNSPESLLVLTAKGIALHFPFEVVESSPVTVPEELQRLIAFHSFPTDEDDIWLYSCLSSGGSYEFDQGEALWADKAVKECVQIGFHLSATVLTSLHIAPAFVPPANNEENGTNNNNNNNPSSIGHFIPYVINPNPNDTQRGQSNFENFGAANENTVNNTNNNGNNNRLRKRGINIEPDYPAHRVSLTFDRQRITSCSCTCTFGLEERCTAVESPSNFGDNIINLDSTENVSNSIKSNSFAYQPMTATEPNSGTLWQFGARNRSIFTNSHINSRQMSGQLNNYFPNSNCLSKNSYNQTSPNSRRSWLFNQHIVNQNNIRNDLMPTNGQNPTGTWCSHVVATCLMRIRQPDKVLLRAPISESLSKLSREDLQKFAQNLICHVGPRKILPAAQLILDQLLAATNNPIKNSAGAPDPTVGGALGDAAAWCFDGGVLEEKLRVTLRRFWAPRPVLYSDIGSLSFNSPTEVENFHCILRSYRANEPRGLWALLSFIRDMMKRQDNNGVLLLEIVTRCILDMNEVMFWWCTVQTNPCHFPESVSVRQKQTQCVAVWLCEEIVQLWSLACLNPELRPILNHVNHKSLSPSSSCGNGLFSTENCKSYSDCCWLLQKIAHRLQAFHAFALKQADIQINLTSTTAKNTMTMVWCDTLGNGLFPNEISSQDDCDIIPKNISLFSGFLPALAACRLSWSSEVPPTYSLSGTEFLKFMPLFSGAHVNSDSETTDYADVILNFSKHYYNSLRSNNDNNNNHSDNCPVELDNYWSIDQMNSQLLNNLPLPENHIEFAFIRFQALNTHGYTEQALHWARFLALLLLYTSNEFINECEQASFEIVGRAKYQSSETNTTNHVANISRNTDNSHRTNLQNPCPANYQSNSRGQQKSVPTSTVSSSWSSNGIPGGVGNSSSGVGGGASSNPRRNSRNGRSRKTGACSNTNNPRETTEKYTNSIKLHPLGKKLSIDYTKKAIRWLDQIRCIMECLSNAHKERIFSIPNSSTNGNIFFPKTTRFDNTNNSIINNDSCINNNNNANHNTTDHRKQTETNNIDLNKSFDIWECIDIELIFRLGFCALKFPRPPCCSPLLEVKLFVIEIALLTRLCFLPIHIACPHVISSIRSEAKQLVSNLTLHQKDIHVPFNLATYLFHQLVGVVRSNGNYLPSQSVNFIPPIHQDTENVAPNINISLMENFFAYPVLSTGAVLAGSGLPLAMDIYNYTNGTTSNHHLLESEKNDHPINVRIASDGELGLQSILSVLGVKSRVPERLFTYFIEGQRTQEDALAVYLFRMYRDDISKLDRIRARLLDRYYNPYFKSPPLWACLSLGSRELMNFQTSNLDYNSVPEVVVTSKIENKLDVSQNTCVSVASTVSLELNNLSSNNNNNNNNSNSKTRDVLILSSPSDTITSKLNNNNLMDNNTILTHGSEDQKHSTIIKSNSTMEKMDHDDNSINSSSVHQGNENDICPNSNNTTDSSDVDNITKLSENDKQYAPANNGNNNNNLCSFDPLSISEDTDTLSDSKLDNLHCTTLYDVRRKISRHLNTIDTTTSAPETTSSDNSPAVTRRLILIGAKSSEAQTTESSDGGGGCGVIAERYKQLSSTLLDPAIINNNNNDNNNNSNNNNNNGTPLNGTNVSNESKDYIQHSDNVRQFPTVDDNVIQSSFSSFSDDEVDDGDDDEDDDDNECIPTEMVTKQSVANSMGVSNENNNDTNNNSFRTNFIQSVPNDTYIRSGSNCESRNDSKFNYTTSKISMSSLPIRNLSTAAGPYRLRIGWHSHLKRPPPQPLSDSMAFHAFQLAETIRECAGGPSTSGSMFVAETEANDTVHRNLQLISFQLGLYGLGLFNRLLPSWQNRTFSRNGGWISQQVFEIGIPAACILYHSWQQHLTAAELTAIAFQLSRANNRSLVDVAAELCLASLSLCTALKPQELYRALEQCGEHSSHTLERGLLCVERSAYQSSHDILPEIYFFIARSWYTLYHSTNKEFEQALNSLESSNNSNQSSLKIRNDNENLSTFNKNNTMNTILSDSNIHVYPNLTNSVQELTNNDINSNSSVTNNNCDIGNSATINTTITTTTNNSNNSITGMSLVSDSNHATSDNKSNNNNPINSINLTSNGLVNAWYYYQSVNLLPPPVVRGDQQPHHQHQEQPNQLMYGASMLSPVNFNYSGFPLGQQQHQYTSLPYYMNMLSLQTPQSLSQQQTNNNNLLNNNSPQLQSTTPPTQRQQQSAHPPPPHHHLPYYLPQSQHMMSPIQSNVPYSFGMSSLPPVGLVQSPNNYFLHPQFIPNTPLPTPSSSQSINMIPSGPFVTIPHHINPSTSLSPTFGTNVLPCNSYQAYSTDQVMEPSLYGFNPAMTAPTVHQSMVCNVLGTPPQSQVQQQQHQTVEPVTSLASINTINNIHSTNNNYVNNVNLNTLSDSTVISVNSLSSVISSALTSTRQLTTSNTASSSVVVHPSMSDQGSIISEGDSCRLAESVADGLGDENNPYSNNSNSSGDLSLNSNNNNKEKLSSNTAKSTVSELQSLKLKAQAYLIRAFFCAKCAIKKISASQSNVNTNFTRQNPIAVSMPSRSIRGKHHHYHMQQSHRGNSTNHSQRRHLIQTDTNSNCMLSTSTRNTITTNDQNNCLPSENSSSMFLMPGVSSSCRASNQVRISSANVISDFNLINATTTSTTTTTTSTTNANSKSCSAHILWTLDVASSLGPLAVNEYCDLVLQCVNCPLLMEQITSKVIDYFEKYAKTHTPSCSVNNGRGGLAHMQQPYIDVSSPNAVISDNNDKNVNFCSNISQNFLNQSHTPNQPWTTSIASVTPVSNWPTNSNPYDLHDVVHPLISLPFPHSDPNNINSTFNYHSFIPPSILPPNNPSWSHPSVRPVSYPILRQNLSSKQLHENLYRFKQMNLNYEPNINASPYILSNNKLNNLNVALNQLPFYNQQTSLWPMNPLSYILPVPVPPPHTVTPSPLTHHQNDMYRNSVMTTTTTGTLGMHHNSYTTTDESIKQKPLEFSGRDVIENLINHTHTLFQKYIDQRLQYIGQSQAEWDEFVDLILKAYNVHLSMPAIDCGLHWNNLLTRIRRHQKCSPALWQRILAGIQTADLKRST